MARTKSKKKQDFSLARPKKIGQVGVGCVTKHGLAKPISFTSVLEILSRAKQINVIRHRSVIRTALDRAVYFGRIEMISDGIYQAKQEVKEAALKAISMLSCEGGSSYDEIFSLCHSFPANEIPDPDELKTFLKMAVDVNILELTDHGKYQVYVKKAKKRKRNSV